MNVIIPDTNVILVATLKFTYDGTIHTQHPFHVNSSKLLNVIKNKNEYPNVSGILLPKVNKECRDKFRSVFRDLRTVAVARQIVKKVATVVVKKLASERTGNATEFRKLREKYFQIIVKDHHLSHPRDIKRKDLGHEIPREIEYLRDLYFVLPVTYINWKEIKQKPLSYRIAFVLRCALKEVLSGYRGDLWPEIEYEIKNLQLNDLSIKNAGLYCFEQMKELIGDDGCLEKAVMPDAELDWHANNETTDTPDSQLRVKRMFEDLFKKYKNTKLPPQLAKHKESEKGGHPHDSDKLILSQAGRMSCVLPPKSKIYIASNDTGFFSPHKGDSTITNAIYIEFGITCANPKRIRSIVFPNSNDKA